MNPNDMQPSLWRSFLFGSLLCALSLSTVISMTRHAKCTEGDSQDGQVVKYDKGLTVKVNNMNVMLLYKLIEAEVNKVMEGEFSISVDEPIEEYVTLDLERISIQRGLRKITTSLKSGDFDGKMVITRTGGGGKKAVFEIHKLGRADIEGKKEEIEAIMQEGHKLFEKGAFRDAAYYFSKAKLQDPNYIDGEWHVGKVFLAEGDYSGAIKKFNEVIENDTTKGEVYFDLGMAYAQAFRHELMMENLRKSLDLTTDEQRKKEIEKTIAKFGSEKEREYFIYMLKADAYRALSDYDKAQNTYAEIIRIFPEKERPYWWLAILLSSIKRDYDKAIEYATALLEMDPDNPSYMMLMSRLYMRSGRLDDAMSILNEARRNGLGFDAMRAVQETIGTIKAMKEKNR